MKIISLLLKVGKRGIAWHIRNIMDGKFYGELRFDIPEKQRFNCKFIEGEFQKNDYATILELLEKIEKTENEYSENEQYVSMLINRNQDKLIAGYSPGDENKTETGKAYKELLIIIENYLKPFYEYIIPEGESHSSALV
jgi:hypothetical protein